MLFMDHMSISVWKEWRRVWSSFLPWFRNIRNNLRSCNKTVNMLHCGFYNRKICLYIAGLQRVIGIWRKKKRDFFCSASVRISLFLPMDLQYREMQCCRDSKGKSVSQRCEQDAFSFYIMSGSISGSDNCTDAFGNKENAAIGIPVDILQSLFCLFISKLKSLLHFAWSPLTFSGRVP